MTARIGAAYSWGSSFVWRRVWGLSLASWTFVVSGLMALVGLLWDGAWHASWGRDSFFIPPHNLMYGGISLSFGVALWILITSSRRPRDPSMARLGSFQAPLGIWASLTGVTIMFIAAAFDDWWHTNIGHIEGDPVLWSPPHFIGMLGGLLSLTGALLFVLREAKTPQRANDKPVWFWQALDTPNFALAMLFAYVAFDAGGISLDRYMIFDRLRFDGSIYPLLALMFGPAVLVLAQRVTNRVGVATFAILFAFLTAFLVGITVRAFGYPRAASLPIMAIPSALLLDLAFARLGRGYRWLLFFGPVFVLVFYVAEYLWAWYLTRYPWWPIERTFQAIPFGVIIGTTSLLLGAWLAERVERGGFITRSTFHV